MELRPGGAGIAVTEANKAEYLQRFAEQRLIGAIRPQLEAFRNGAGPRCEGAASAHSSARLHARGFVRSAP